MKTTVLPKTPLGRWSVGMAAFCVLVFVLATILAGLVGIESAFVGPVFGIAMATSGVAALVVGLVSTVWRKERSVIVFLATLVGLFVLAFIIGDIVVPH